MMTIEKACSGCGVVFCVPYHHRAQRHHSRQCGAQARARRSASGDMVLLDGHSVGHTVEPNGCWKWQGSISPNGYGTLGTPLSRQTRSAHRVYFEKINGPVELGFELDHLCRNRWCVNPSHMEVVTRRVNVRRGLATKLNKHIAQSMRDEYRRGGTSYRMVALNYGVSKATAGAVISGRLWADQ
jgi:hypothetical protein